MPECQKWATKTTTFEWIIHICKSSEGPILMVIEIFHPYTKMFGVSYLCRDCPANETMQHAQSISRDVCKRLVGIGTVGAFSQYSRSTGLVGNEIPYLLVWCLAHRQELAIKVALKVHSLIHWIRWCYICTMVVVTLELYSIFPSSHLTTAFMN